MQQILEMIEKPNLIMPPLSSLENVEKAVDIFREKGIDITYQESLRWTPGTYKKFKEIAMLYAFPHWESKSGANKPSKLFHVNRWHLQKISDIVRKADNDLRIARAAGFSRSKLAGDAQEYLAKFYDEIPSSEENIKIAILPYAWNAGRNIAPIKTSRSLIDVNFNEVSASMPEAKKRIKNLKAANLYKSPKEWFLNIAIALKDIDIDITLGNNKDTNHSQYYGDLVVTFSIDIFSIVSAYFHAKNNNTSGVQTLLSTKMSSIVFQCPHNRSLAHPFVQKDAYNSYGLGNVCYGSFESDLIKSIANLDFYYLKVLLRTWASKFKVGITNPLNTINNSFINIPIDMDTDLRSTINASNTSICGDLFKEYEKDKELMFLKYCSNCKAAELNSCNTLTRNINDDIRKHLVGKIVAPIRIEDFTESSNLNISPFAKSLLLYLIDPANGINEESHLAPSLGNVLTDIHRMTNTIGKGNGGVQYDFFSKMCISMLTLWDEVKCDLEYKEDRTMPTVGQALLIDRIDDIRYLMYRTYYHNIAVERGLIIGVKNYKDINEAEEDQSLQEIIESLTKDSEKNNWTLINPPV